MRMSSPIRNHPFFSCINWEKLERLEITPPFIPKIRNPKDTSNFDQEFTRERASLTPPDRNLLETMRRDAFEGFSFTNPVF